MYHRPLSARVFRSALATTFGVRAKEDAFYEQVKECLQKEGIRLGMVYAATPVRRSDQGVHLMLRAEILRDHETYTDCVLKLNQKLSVFDRKEEIRKASLPSWGTCGNAARATPDD